MNLYHYTCSHHVDGIRESGVLVPAWVLNPAASVATGRVVWLTDLDAPDVDGLGLTQHMLRCDRTEHRFRVVDAVNLRRWGRVRSSWDPALVDELELSFGAQPRHWWVADEATVTYAPIGVAA